MKIGFDAKRANSNNTGLGNYSRFIIDALALFAKNNTYLLYVPKRKENNEYETLLNSHSSIEERQPNSPWRGALSAIWRTITIKNDLNREEVNIYHGLSNEIPLWLKGGKVKSIVTIHDLIFIRHPECYKPIDRWIYNLKLRYACRNADHIIAVSECTKRDIVELYKIEPQKIDVIYQGCAAMFAESYSDDEKLTVRDRYALPKRFILNVGTLERRKNLLLCVKALENLPDDIHLVACGKATSYSKEVMRYAKKRGIDGRITLIHNCRYKDLPIIYQCSEVMVYPSKYEGFGIPIIEALNSGIPVVATTGSCLEEAGGDAATYVDTNDSIGCANAINEFISDSTIRESAIIKGKEYVKRFSKEHIAKQIFDLYERVINI